MIDKSDLILEISKLSDKIPNPHEEKFMDKHMFNIGYLRALVHVLDILDELEN